MVYVIDLLKDESEKAFLMYIFYLYYRCIKYHQILADSVGGGDGRVSSFLKLKILYLPARSI